MCVGRDPQTQDVVAAIDKMKAENQAQVNKPDMVNQPPHYAKWKIEPITFIMENNLPFHTGNLIKYSVRAGSKQYDGMSLEESEIVDLQKVIRYAEMRINQIRGTSPL